MGNVSCEPEAASGKVTLEQVCLLLFPCLFLPAAVAANFSRDDCPRHNLGIFRSYLQLFSES